jgi:rhomboid protease GluP
MKMEQAGDVRKLGPPWLTFALLAALIVVFCTELAAGLDPPAGWLQPSVRTLVAMGGSNRLLIVDGGEWFRVISAPFLHGGLVHVALNGLVLLWGGSLLERMLGRAWFAAIYTVSGVTGVLASLAINEAALVSVGASGALMGLMASLFVTSFHFPPGPLRSRLRTAALEVLIPSMLPVVTAVTGLRVDYGAHLGGAVGGGLMALVLLMSWPRSEQLPRLRWFAAAIAFAGLAAVIVTAWKIESSFVNVRREIESNTLLIPDSQLPRTEEQWKAQVKSLAGRYPHDPRPRLFLGIMLLEEADSAGAERELRTGLADMAAVRELLPPGAETLLRTNLAIALSDRKKAEAKTVAEPVCRLESAGNRQNRTRLTRLGLCD